jgi:hypothetical protein
VISLPGIFVLTATTPRHILISQLNGEPAEHTG